MHYDRSSPRNQHRKQVISSMQPLHHRTDYTLTSLSSDFRVLISCALFPSESISCSICALYAVTQSSFILAESNFRMFEKEGHVSLFRKSSMCPNESTYVCMHIAKMTTMHIYDATTSHPRADKHSGETIQLFITDWWGWNFIQLGPLDSIPPTT